MILHLFLHSFVGDRRLAAGPEGRTKIQVIIGAIMPNSANTVTIFHVVFYRMQPFSAQL